ncbi:Uncharacterised protein [Mycobacterium tuberculosis]|nr:Uncharacterised protein [Mycobacterium tuberculosis]
MSRQEPVDPALQRFLGPQGHEQHSHALHRPLAQPLGQRDQQRNRGEIVVGTGDDRTARDVGEQSGGQGATHRSGDHHRPAAAQGADTGECGREDRPPPVRQLRVDALHNPGKQLDHYLLNMSLEKLAAVRGVVVSAHNNC